MKTAIMGAGGLGCYFGGQLLRTGVDVTFIARGAQLNALAVNGLQVKDAPDDYHIQPVQATDDPAQVGPVDLILLCVKAYDVVPAAEAMRPMIGAQTAILPVLNGVDHIEILGELLGAEHVLGGQASVTAHLLSPGVVQRLGEHAVVEFGEVNGGLTDRVRAIEQVLNIEGMGGKAVPDIRTAMWRKFVAICAVGIFSVVRGDLGVLRRASETIDLTEQVVDEGVAVAAAHGIDLADVFADWSERLTPLPDTFKPSMLVDLERGRRIEVEALNGAMSRIGRAVGVPTPVNDFIYVCLKPHVDGT